MGSKKRKKETRIGLFKRKLKYQTFQRLKKLNRTNKNLFESTRRFILLEANSNLSYFGYKT